MDEEEYALDDEIDDSFIAEEEDEDDVDADLADAEVIAGDAESAQLLLDLIDRRLSKLQGA